MRIPVAKQRAAAEAACTKQALHILRKHGRGRIFSGPVPPRSRIFALVRYRFCFGMPDSLLAMCSPLLETYGKRSSFHLFAENRARKNWFPRAVVLF
jgi:hypothetical protein